MDAFTPQQTTELVSRIGTKKAQMRLDKLFWNSFMASPLLGFGYRSPLSQITTTIHPTLVINTAPWYQENAPGLIRMLGAIIFPVGLVMIVLTGADLFTSNVMFMTVAFLHRRISIIDLAKNWVVSYLGNLAGMLFYMALITGYGGVFEAAAYRQETIDFATLKTMTPQWHQIFLRGIGANWLVCLAGMVIKNVGYRPCIDSIAVFISISSREIVSKIIAIWWPTATFVACGMDHVVANMYFMPIAIWNSHPQLTVGVYIWKSMIPAAIGNIIGGGLFVAAAYWYLYLTGTGSVDIDFNIGSLDTAMEAGGPLGNMGSTSRQGGKQRPEVIDGKAIDSDDAQGSSDSSAHQLPHSGSGMTSAIGKELDGQLYAKSRSQRVDEEKAVGAT
ncbi:MAG: hypothetical protein Q9174_005770 [Haloplaca sp. 1 TL-2023]